MILFQVAVAFLGGVVFAAAGLTAGWPLLALSGAGLSGGLYLAGRKQEALLSSLLVLVALAGVERYAEAAPSAAPGGVAILNEVPGPESEGVTVRGVIVDEPEESGLVRRFTVEVDAYLDAAAEWQAAPGRVLVTTRLYPEYAYGDAVQLTGRLETPPVLDDFDYREYLARRGIVSTVLYPDIEVLGHGGGDDLTRQLQDVRRQPGRALERALPEPESALARGILLGQRASIPDALTDDFNRAGISHLIAISGQNVVLVAGCVVATLAGFIGRRPATAVAIGVVWVYAVFVGASPTVLRAALMGTVMLGAEIAGRPGRGLSAIVLAAAVMVAFRPLLVDDVAFQLSFAACLGIVAGAHQFRGLIAPSPDFTHAWLGRLTVENLAVTSAASIAVLPVIATTFGRISLVSLPANLIAAPAFILALLGSAATAIAGLVHPDLGRLVAEVAYLPLTFLVKLGGFAAALPGASVEVSGFGAVAAVLFTYLVLAAGYLYLRSRPMKEPEGNNSVALRPALAASALVVVAALSVWWSLLQPGTGRLRVTVLDVGQGDAILIESPRGHRILVDGGPSGSALLNALGRALPAAERRIDLVVLTHPQDDHVTGLVELLRRYEVGAAMAGRDQGVSGAYLAWREELARRGVPLLSAVAGQAIELGREARVEVLAPSADGIRGTEDDVNNNSVVVRLVQGSISFLLTGDLAGEGEAALLDSGAGVRSTVLKVGHHGSDGSTTPAFLEAVAPEFAVISSGDENAFGHPSPTTRLRLAGVALLRTDLNGDVRFETDGSALWVSYERGGPVLVEAVAGR